MSSSYERRVLTRVNPSCADDEIVISGIAGRFPNSANVAEFADNLYNKVDLVDDLETRWRHLNEEIPKRYGKVGNLDKFDANFFSVPIKQSMNMDPQARMLQEHAYESVLDAGICPKSIRGSRTGVFIGCCAAESDEFYFYGPAIKDGLGLTGTSRALLANRISFALDLKGPSFMVDTACSSSGYALDLAFSAIRNGEIDAALVGGTNLLLHPGTTLQFFRLGVLSKDGICRPFDKDASGYCRSEAVNMIFLQKAKDAKRVYAKLVYTKTNVDGFKNEGLTYPSGAIQIKLLEEFYKDVGVDPSIIDYVESHSTGTKVGDPEECFTLDTIFCKNRKQPLPVGSVKSNMGHSEASSSINSVIKSLFAFERGLIPPNINFKTPRPGIPSLDAGRLQVVTDPQEFKGSLISVNSFGFGGANSHALLKINPREKVNFGIPCDDLPRIVLWSGRTEEAVNTILDSVTKQPLDAEYVALLQNIQTSTQSSNTYRGYGIFSQNKIVDDHTNHPNANCISRHVDNFASSKRPIVFVYSGMGSQWSGMGADLMKIPLFESAINKCHEILAAKQLDLKGILTSNDAKMFDNILHSFVGIAAIQIGLTDVLRAIGIEPDFIIGHSVGELGCAYADGCLTAEEMILSAYSRGMASLETKVLYGSMAAVGVGFKELKDMLVDGVEIACHNSADSSTISGPADIIADYVESLKSKNYFAREVACSNIPYHSSYISEMGSKLLSRLREVIKVPRERSSKWISSSVPYAKWNNPENRFSSSEYHTNNLLSAVLFEESSEHLPKNALTIEVAPHGLLQAILKRSFPDGLHVGVTKRGHKENSLFFMEALGKIFENGIDMDISKLYPPIQFPVSRSTPMISPSIRWDHSESFFVPKHDVREVNEMICDISIQDAEYKYMAGHEIDGRVLFPATGYLFLVWKLASDQNRVLFNKFDVEFEDVKFLRATHIPKDKNVELTVVINRGTGKFEVIEGKNAIVTGFVHCADDTKLTPMEDESEQDVELTTKDFYKELRLRGYHYKDLFKSVISAKMNGTGGKIKWQSNWVAFLDCLLQLQIIAKDSRSLALPIGIRRIVIKTKEHLAALDNDSDNIMTAHYSRELNMLRCGGVEIRGLNAQIVSRRPPPGLPVLESYQFIPHFPSPNLSNGDMARFCVQLALENLQILKVSAVEIDMNDEKVPLSETFRQALSDLPLVTATLTYLTAKKDEMELEGVDISDGDFSEFTNVTFVIRSNCLADAQFMEAIASQNENVFIVSREPMESKILQIYGLTEGFNIVAVIPSGDETIVLIRFCKTRADPPTNVIKITNDNYEDWLPKLKEAAKKSPTIAYAQNEKISGVLGLVNCIRKEPNGINLKCVFIDDPNAPAFDISCPFYKYQLEKDLSMNVYRDGEWGSYKHLLLTPSYEARPHEICCYANSLLRGDLSSIKWLQSPLEPHEDGIVKVQYASLNFRDVMLATGKLAAETVSHNRFDLLCIMGFEFSGTVADGRRVMGMTCVGSLASHVRIDEGLLWEVPHNWTLAEAATIPVVYGTVYTAFFLTTKISEGKSILIHAGTGGVGLAAIRVALAYGMVVFTTVSTEEKKNYLLTEFPELNPKNIGNSRDVSFEDLIMKRTRGEGVDFVLNSLAEEKLLASVRCLGKKGKFLEIGKFDMANDNKLGMGDFLKELTFHAILVDNMFKAPMEEKLVLKRLLDVDLKRGIIKPLKTNIFKPDEIEKAFRFLASAKHIGKVIIEMRANESDNMTLPMPLLPRIYCNANLSYIISGGLGGFGLELADWLVLRGCKKLVLSSSRGITKPYQPYRIRVWESYGVTVVVNTDDITTWEGCDKLIKDAIKLGPVGGIYNLAVRLSDSILENQECASFVECMAPKAVATDYLDKVSRQQCPLLEHFVVFSSVSCGRGNAGQSNYGMANSVMERIIEQRHKDNLPGKAIQWGAIGEVGIVADMQDDKMDMEIGGTLQQRISSCLEELDTLMTVNSPIVSSMVVAEKRFIGGSKGGIVEMIMNIMSIRDIKTLSLETKLSELGMDSLMTVEISQALEREFNLVVSPQELRSMTLCQLKAFEKNSSDVGSENGQMDGIAFLLRNWGDETRSQETIIKLESMMNEGYTKALLVPGVEGVGGKVYYNLARSLKYPTYLLQFANCWDAKGLDEMYAGIIDDVLELYENETTFILIGYSYGAMMTLKLAKTLEELGKTGKIILIDGAPELLKRLLTERVLAEGEDFEESMQKHLLYHSFKMVLPKDSTDRLTHVIKERGWDAKLKKIDELYNDFKLYSKEYVLKCFSALYNRIKLLSQLDLKYFQPLNSTPVTLLKPSETSLAGIVADYGLGIYSPANVIEIHVINGNHMSMMENSDLPNAINQAF